MLLDYLSRGPAKVIVYDVNFAEPDDQGGFEFGSATLSGAESDQCLADSIKAAGNVILLADATYEAGEGGSREFPDAGFRAGRARHHRAARRVSPVRRAGCRQRGPRTQPVRSGSRRPATAHGALRADWGSRAAIARPVGRPAGSGDRPRHGPTEGTILTLGDRAMPLSSRRVRTQTGTDAFFWGLINFRGPALLEDLKSRTYPTYSVFDLLSSEQQILSGGKPDIDPAMFRDKLVFVGVTASGLFDVFETPFSNGEDAGHQHPRRRGGRRAVQPLHAARVARRHARVGARDGARSSALIATRIPAWWATAVTAIIVAGFAVVATRAFAGGYWLNLSQPALAASFALFGGVGYQYFVEGREKRKMKRLFGQYVSKDVYDQLVNNPALARLGGQRREMTVLFSDIRGFTSVSEKGEPEDIVQTLNEYFTRMVDIVFKHKGTLDKFVGDMVMALFGAPLDDVDHAEHAVDAALEMIDRAADSSTSGGRRKGARRSISASASTPGPMIAGQYRVGSDHELYGDRRCRQPRLPARIAEQAVRHPDYHQRRYSRGSSGSIHIQAARRRRGERARRGRWPFSRSSAGHRGQAGTPGARRQTPQSERGAFMKLWMIVAMLAVSSPAYAQLGGTLEQGSEDSGTETEVRRPEHHRRRKRSRSAPTSA